MKRFLFLFSLMCSPLIAVTGDIQSVTVRSEVWTADVAIEGLNTGGSYDFGLGTNNTVTGSPKVVFTVVSHSFADDGSNNVQWFRNSVSANQIDTAPDGATWTTASSTRRCKFATYGY